MIRPQGPQERMSHDLDSGCVFKVEPTGFANELDQQMRERVKGDSQAFGLSTREDGVAVFWGLWEEQAWE